MDKKTLTVSANGMEFYCEMMGHGPTMVLVPDDSGHAPHRTMTREMADIVRAKVKQYLRSV